VERPAPVFAPMPSMYPMATNGYPMVNGGYAPNPMGGNYPQYVVFAPYPGVTFAQNPQQGSIYPQAQN
jgi:hypothetical protein